METERQRSPKNAVEIATLLLAACYGGRHATLSLLVSSARPDIRRMRHRCIRRSPTARSEMMRLLLARGARTDVGDRLFHATPLGWAEHCRQPAIAALVSP